jgi:hypothetical protein
MPSSRLECRSIIRTVRVIRAKALGGALFTAGEMPDTSWIVCAAKWRLSSSQAAVAELASPAEARDISGVSSRTGGKRSTGK